MDTHVNLGLDLAGGIHLVLGVDLDKAIENKANRLTQRIADRFVRDEVDVEAVNQLEGDKVDHIEVVTKTPEDLDKYLEDMSKIEFEVVEKEPTRLVHRLAGDYIDRLKKDAIAQAMRSIRNRVDSLGVAEPQINARGGNQIVVQLPGLEDPEAARRVLGKTAQLEFRMVLDEDTTTDGMKNKLPAGVVFCQDSYQKPNGSQGQDRFLIAADRNKLVEVLGAALSGDKAAAIQEVEARSRPFLRRSCAGALPVEDDEKLYRSYTLTRTIPLSGDHVVDAFVTSDPQTGKPEVSLIFNEPGRKIFGSLTTKNVGNRFAIVLEGMVDSAPVIQTAITGGSCRITLGSLGDRNQVFREAEQLAIVLKSGALPAPITIEQDRTVGSSLGEDSIKAGRNAILGGSLLVIIFMIIYYGFAGIVADIALALNLLFILAVLGMFGATLTLPGIAGMVLTIGMAVDANVIIFERIREELRRGKTAKSALSVGYDNAMSAIVDVNLTTGIAGIVLWQYGSGPIKGFAVTLVVGIMASLFTAIYVTRTIFEWRISRSQDATLSVGIDLTGGRA
ncbi:MAG: protein translocase subunit SecD [Myxococcales bacterium]|nr:protein translocase subunit SecD [Myxococcales bacterium]